jgi:hypothetical protein
MMEPRSDARAPVCVRVNQPDQQDVLVNYRDPTLLVKKGRLFALCLRDTSPELQAELYARYYADPSHDIVPVLQRVLAALDREYPSATAQIPLVAVLEGLNLSAVGTAEAALWLDRFGQARALLPDGREARPLPTAQPQGAAPLIGASYRLSIGDVLILTTQTAMQTLNERGWKGLARGSLEHHARSMAGKAGHKPPVTLISVPGFAPVADMGPVRRVPGPTPAARVEPRLRKRSPIWPALFLAAAAVAVVFAIKQPELSQDSLLRLFDWVLTPVPTGTAPPKGTPYSQTRAAVVLPTATPEPETPTPTPRATTAGTQAPTVTPTLLRYTAPELIYPGAREELAEFSVTLRWAWAGSLAADEWFDVRMWREGMPETSIAWTKERSYLERYLRPGWYHWTVVVVRGRGRTVVAELCDKPASLSFLVLGEGTKRSTPTATPVPTATEVPVPTRVTPVVRPTRASDSG